MSEVVIAALAKRNYEWEHGDGSWPDCPADARLGWVKGAQATVEFLARHGFGPVAEAKAQALESAARELSQLPYVRPGHPGRADYERVLAVRRGNTDVWLADRAKQERKAS